MVNQNGDPRHGNDREDESSARAQHPAGRALPRTPLGGSGRGAPDGTPDAFAMPNPYDLATWQRMAGAAHRAGTDHATTSDPDREPPADPASHTAPDGRDSDAQAPEDSAEVYDPPVVEVDGDRHELARRTVNRSRAAARDLGLFPISAKRQARDVRDRSTSAPGYSGSRPDPRDPQGIEQIMRRVLGDLGWNEGMNAGRVLEDWEAIVGQQVADHCHPVSLEDGVLVVSASSSAWASQMRMLAPRMISTIEEYIGAHVISEMKVTGPAAAQRNWKRGRRTVTWRGPRDTYG